MKCTAFMQHPSGAHKKLRNLCISIGVNMRKTRTNIYCDLNVCENGHAKEIDGTDKLCTEVLCHYGRWTLYDNYCQYCGSTLRPELIIFIKRFIFKPYIWFKLRKFLRKE